MAALQLDAREAVADVQFAVVDTHGGRRAEQVSISGPDIERWGSGEGGDCQWTGLDAMVGIVDVGTCVPVENCGGERGSNVFLLLWRFRGSRFVCPFLFVESR